MRWLTRLGEYEVDIKEEVTPLEAPTGAGQDYSAGHNALAGAG